MIYFMMCHTSLQEDLTHHAAGRAAAVLGARIQEPGCLERSLPKGKMLSSFQTAQGPLERQHHLILPRAYPII